MLGAAGTLVALVRARSYFMVFCAFWSMGIFAAYTLVPYKTPWLVLSIHSAVHHHGRCHDRRSLPASAASIHRDDCGTGIVFSLYQAIDVSFVNYDNDVQCIYLRTYQPGLSVL